MNRLRALVPPGILTAGLALAPGIGLAGPDSMEA